MKNECKKYLNEIESKNVTFELMESEIRDYLRAADWFHNFIGFHFGYEGIPNQFLKQFAGFNYVLSEALQEGNYIVKTHDKYYQFEFQLNFFPGWADGLQGLLYNAFSFYHDPEIKRNNEVVLSHSDTRHMCALFRMSYDLSTFVYNEMRTGRFGAVNDAA